MNHEISEAEGLLLSTELRRVYGDRASGAKWFLPFSDVEATLAFLKTVPSNSGDRGVRQALAQYTANEAARIAAVGGSPVKERAMVTVDVAIREALRALGGERSIREVKAWIGQTYGDRWKDVGTAMADLTYPPNRSTSYSPERQCLERVAKGIYKLRQGY